MSAGVDRLAVTMVTDNYVDMLLPDLPYVSRKGLIDHFSPRTTKVRAENGLAMHVEVRHGRYTYSVLFDTGLTPEVLLHNLDALDIDAASIDHLVLSHGHPDHYGGLLGLLDERAAPLPISMHRDALLPRYVRLASGQVAPYYNAGLSTEAIRQAGGAPIFHDEPLQIGPGLIATGPIPREVPFEAPATDLDAPNSNLQIRDGAIVADIIPDDQALIVLLGDDAIVVIAGCAHAGIINTIRYATEFTGRRRVVGVFGGFHLGFPGTPAQRAAQTISELQALNVEIVAPSHCTGMRSIMEIAAAMPVEFLHNVTGSRVCLRAGDDPRTNLDAL